MKIGAIYGVDFLDRFMHKNRYCKEEIKEMVDKFIWGFPDHNFAILRHMAKDIGLKVIDTEDYHEWKKLEDVWV